MNLKSIYRQCKYLYLENKHNYYDKGGSNDEYDNESLKMYYDWLRKKDDIEKIKKPDSIESENNKEKRLLNVVIFYKKYLEHLESENKHFFYSNMDFLHELSGFPYSKIYKEIKEYKV